MMAYGRPDPEQPRRPIRPIPTRQSYDPSPTNAASRQDALEDLLDRVWALEADWREDNRRGYIR